MKKNLIYFVGVVLYLASCTGAEQKSEKTKYTDLWQIYMSNQIDTLTKANPSLIKTINDATIIVPMIKDYYDVGIKNDEQLVKLASVVQRLVAKGEASGEGSSMILSEDERKQLMEEVITISKGE